MFPLTFLANTFVATADLPSVLRTFAEWNPLSAVVAAVRHLFGNPEAIPAGAAWPLEHSVLAAVAWCFVIIAVCVPLSVRRYQRMTG
jgi:ABC-2 type transport system permease protein